MEHKSIRMRGFRGLSKEDDWECTAANNSINYASLVCRWNKGKSQEQRIDIIQE